MPGEPIIIPIAAVIPVKKDNVSDIRYSAVVFVPRSELLEKLHHSAASALCRDDIRHAGLYCASGYEGCAPRILIAQLKPSCHRLVTIVGIDDLLVAAVGLLTSEPGLCLLNEFFCRFVRVSADRRFCV